MAGDGYLNQWWFWIILIFVFLVIVYFYTRITGQGIREATRTSQTQDTTRSESRSVKGRTYWRKAVTIPDIETVLELEEIGQIEELDFTPKLPRHITPERKYNQKKQSKGEAECLRVAEDIYKVPFQVQVRPTWLRNPKTGRCLELDISELEYLKIAIEYNGKQHYVFTERYHKNFEAFQEQLYRDKLKYDLCLKHGIYLITVPYNVPVNEIEGFIRYYLPEAVKAREDLQPYNSVV